MTRIWYCLFQPVDPRQTQQPGKNQKRRHTIRNILLGKVAFGSASKSAELEGLASSMYTTVNAVILHVLQGHGSEASDTAGASRGRVESSQFARQGLFRGPVPVFAAATRSQNHHESTRSLDARVDRSNGLSAWVHGGAAHRGDKTSRWRAVSDQLDEERLRCAARVSPGRLVIISNPKRDGITGVPALQMMAGGRRPAA